MALAVKATAEVYGDKEQAKHILHAADYFDRLRLHRNHYVHRLVSVGMHAGKEFELMANAYSLSARGRVKVVEQPVSLDEISQFFKWCCVLEVYAMALLDRPSAAMNALLPKQFPEMPALPPKLKESKRYLFAPDPPKNEAA